jgi:small subunit ribosomal protein S17
MADEPNDETTENETPDGAVEQAPEAEAAPETDATTEADAAAEPASDAAPEAEAASDAAPEPAPAAEAAEEAPVEADVDSSAQADAADADSAPDVPADAASSATEPVQQLPPKERRRRARSTHTGDARPSRSPEERHAERVETRRAKAKSRRARRLQERAKAAERRAGAPAPEPLAPVHAPVEGRRRVRQGIVVSDKAAKTITVRIDVARRHRRYEKIVRSSSTVHAHDENNDAHEGDVVRVIESRPLSRTKRWALVDVLERAR